MRAYDAVLLIARTTGTAKASTISQTRWDCSCSEDHLVHFFFITKAPKRLIPVELFTAIYVAVSGKLFALFQSPKLSYALQSVLMEMLS